MFFNSISKVHLFYWILRYADVSKDTKLPNHKFVCINYDSHTRCIVDYIRCINLSSHTHTHWKPQATYKNAHGENECDAVFLCNLKYLWGVWPIFYLTYCNVLKHVNAHRKKTLTNISNMSPYEFFWRTFRTKTDLLFILSFHTWIRTSLSPFEVREYLSKFHLHFFSIYQSTLSGPVKSGIMYMTTCILSLV